MSKGQRKKKIVKEFIRLVEIELDKQGNGKADTLWNIIKEKRLERNRKGKTSPK